MSFSWTDQHGAVLVALIAVEDAARKLIPVERALNTPDARCLEGGRETLVILDDVRDCLVELAAPENVDDVRRLPDSLQQIGLDRLLAVRDNTADLPEDHPGYWCADWYYERIEQPGVALSILANPEIHTTDDLICAVEKTDIPGSPDVRKQIEH